MKRNQIYILLMLAVLLTATVIVWHRSDTTKKSIAPDTASEIQTPTNSSKVIVSNSSTSETIAPSNLPHAPGDPFQKLNNMTGVTPDMPAEQVRQKVADYYTAQSLKLAAENQRPVEFYGQTVDENNKPVAGVNVDLSLSEPPNPGPHGTLETNLLSDTQGNFFFGGAVGKTLQVNIHKSGYYTSKSNRVDFDYTGYQSNPSQSEVFHLRKKGAGADLVTSQYGISKDWSFSTPLDGTPVRVDLFNRKLSEDGQMEISAVKPDRLKQERANEWSFRMSITDGGFVEQDDEFPFEAPETGYQSTIEFHFKMGDPGWTETVHKSYYITFGQPRRYGRLDLDTQMYWGTRLTYAINPDGSKYLEPK